MTVEELVEKRITPGMIEVFSGWDGEYRWRLIGTDGRTICTSPTRYPTRASARASAQREGSRFGAIDIVEDK
jgi:uncharacterized protein YegP (UPF0339 family)